MQLKKLIIFQLISIVAAVISFFLYYRDGFFINFSFEFLKNNIQQILVLSGLFISNLLVSHSFIANKAKNKKTNLKFSLLILTLITLFFAFFRIKEAINLEFHMLAIINLVLFICLIIINIKLLKDLRNLIRKIIVERKNKN